MSVVGIDIGTSKLCVAVAKQGGIEIILNEESSRFTPASVSFQGQSRYVGSLAKQQQFTNARNFVWNIKRLIGRRNNDNFLDLEKSLMACQFVAAPNGDIAVKVDFDGKEAVYDGTQLMAMLLTEVKDFTELAIGMPLNDCVVAVPSFYTDYQRRCMLSACQIVGLNCLKLINETTAAALGHGIFQKGYPAADQPAHHTCIVDVGYCHANASLVAFNEGKMKVLSHTSDLHLGGRTFDMKLADYFVEDFKQKYKFDTKTKLKNFLKLLTETEKIKKLMSTNTNKIPLNIECFWEDRDVASSMTRADFESMCKDDVVPKFTEMLKTVLTEAKLTPKDVKEVEIIGASTRMPLIKRIIVEVFAQEPQQHLNADEAVARGAAIQCAILSPNFKVKDFGVTDCQPYPIQVSWPVGKEENDYEVFPRFHPFPFSRVLTLFQHGPFTVKARYSFPNEIPHTETHVGSFTIEGVTPPSDPNAEDAAKGSKVKVKCRLNPHGIFTIAEANQHESYQVPVEPPTAPVVTEPMDTGAPTEPAPGGEASVSTATSEADDSSKNKEADAMESSITPGEVPATPDESAPSKMKTKVRARDLPIRSALCPPEPDSKKMNAYREMENMIISSTKAEKDRANARNLLEETVLDWKHKLTNEDAGYAPFLGSEKEVSAAVKKLDSLDSWLYDEGESETKTVYLDRLTDLSKILDPVKMRFRESEQRPLAVEELGKALQKYSKAYDALMLPTREAKWAHLEQADLDKLANIIKETSTYRDTICGQFASLPKHTDPATKVVDIQTHQRTFVKQAQAVLDKPKPAPKKEQPPPVPQDGEKSKTETPMEQNGDTKAHEGDASQPAPEMDVD